MEVMSREEWREFVLAGTRTAKAGFTRADGTPLVTPVWITLDGEDVVFTTPGGSGMADHPDQRHPAHSRRTS
jgi:hypothetical protein